MGLLVQLQRTTGFEDKTMTAADITQRTLSAEHRGKCLAEAGVLRVPSPCRENRGIGEQGDRLQA